MRAGRFASSDRSHGSGEVITVLVIAVLSAIVVFAPPGGQATAHSSGVDFLMRKASQRFVRAGKAMARHYGHDRVIEAGGIAVVHPEAPAPPDRTNETIAALSR